MSSNTTEAQSSETQTEHPGANAVSETVAPAQNKPQLSGDMKYCHGCGNQVHSSAKSCPSCGAAIKTGKGKSKTATALFAFFLGGFGAHRFYLGSVGLGILYLLFCWTLIPALIAFGEFIYFLAISEDRFDEKYN